MRKKGKRIAVILENLLIVFLVVTLVVVGFRLWRNRQLFKQASSENWQDYKPGEQGSDSEALGDIASSGDSDEIKDIVGWITLDDTGIDYPIVQGTSNMEYLSKDPTGAPSLSGSIFLDVRNSSDFSDTYSMIYGHHMEFGKMFGALDQYLDDDYLTSHTQGSLIIGDDAKNTRELTVIACIETNAEDSVVYGNPTNEERYAYLSDKTSEEVTGQILALSTCADGDSLDRIVLFCVLGN